MNVQSPLFYEKQSMHVDIYDLQTAMGWGSTHRDTEFYIQQAQLALKADAAAGGPGGVLELACGTGRILFPLAQAVEGQEVHGLDASEAMLRVAESKRAALLPEAASHVHLHTGNMEDFDLKRKFAFIYVPFRSFQMMWTAEAQEKSMQCILRHMAPDGTLIINLFDPRHELLHAGIQRTRMLLKEVPHPVTGNIIRVEVLERENDPLLQQFQELWRFSELDAAGNILRTEDETVRLRWTFRYEMKRLAMSSGFRVLAEYSDFEGSAPAYGKEQIWVLRPA